MIETWKIRWYDTIGSTNDELKILAAKGAPQGTAVAAHTQTGGKGRLGRQFQSPPGTGMYLSVLLRPQAPFEDCAHLTCAVAVAVAKAIESVSGVAPGIKWPNDLTWNRLKLGGILTEISAKDGVVEWAVVGIGINCRAPEEGFAPEIATIATDLQIACGKKILPEELAQVTVQELKNLAETFLSRKTQWLEQYRKICVTTGQRVTVITPTQTRQALALDVAEDGSLLVEYENGIRENVSSGEVSVRGMFGQT